MLLKLLDKHKVSVSYPLLYEGGPVSFVRRLPGEPVYLRVAGRPGFDGDYDTVYIMCMMCNTRFFVSISDEEVRRWRGGEHIQNVVPHLSPDDRELLISSVCGGCFDAL